MHKHHHHKKHSEDLAYHLQDERLSIHFLDGYSPDMEGDISFSHFHHGHGGQNVNKSNKGVHAVFTPDGSDEKIIASCIDERSEIQNKRNVLKSLLEKIEERFKQNPPRVETEVPHHTKTRRLEDKKKRSRIKSARQIEEY